MTRLDRRTRLLAACLAALAGYVDAIGFSALGGFFVSFMSGNSTRLGVGLVGSSHQALTAGGLVAAFVAGVILGSLIGDLAPRRRPSVLALVAGLLAVAAALALSGEQRAGIACMALAMGAENAAFARDGAVGVGLTYMTGTLVKLGQSLAAALRGGERRAWAPHLMLWASLVAGAVAGAAAYPRLGLGGLWIAAAWAAACALASGRLDEAPD